METLLILFYEFFKIGAFSFGGGYAMIPIIEREMIRKYNWMTMAEFRDMITISEMTPGPIAINSATFLGYRVAGIPGSIVSTVAVVIPSLIVMSILLMLLDRYKNSESIEVMFAGIRPVIIGLVGSAAVSVGRGVFTDIRPVIIGLSVFYLVASKKLNGIHAIILAGIVGVLVY